MNALLFIFLAAPSEALVKMLGVADESAIALEAVQRNTNDPASDLSAIANDTTQSLLVRGRAVILLAAFPGTSAALIALSSATTPAVRVKTMIALRRVLQTGSASAQIRAVLESRLDDDNLFVRLHAVTALSLVPGERALLVRRLRTEKEPRVRDAIAHALAN